MRRREITAVARLGLALAVLLACGGRAWALGFDLDSFKPAPTATGYLCEESARLLPAGTVDLGLSLGYAYRPLVVRSQIDGAVAGDVVTYRSTAYLTAAYGLLAWADVGMRLPVVLAQAGDVAVDLTGTGGVPQHPAAHALGDLELLARARLLAPPDGVGFRLTVTAPLSLPIGDTDALVGTGSVSFRPRIIAGWEAARLSLAASAGYEFRQRTEVPGSTFVVGQAIGAGAGAAFLAVQDRIAFLDTLTVLAEASVSIGLEQPESGLPATPTQALFGLRTRLPGEFLLQGAVGTGLNRAVGSPRLRALITVARTWDTTTAKPTATPKQ